MDESLIYRVPAQPKNPLEDFVKEEEPSQIFSAMPEKSVEPPKTGIAYQEPTLQKKSSNPLENLPEVEKTQPEQSDEPPSIGKIVAGGHDLISKIKTAQSGRTGRNAREVAREKALDNQAILQVYSAMQARLSERGYDDPTLVNTLGTNNGGGLRSAEDIDRLFEIKAKGLEYRTQDGNIAKLQRNAPWSAILAASDEAGGITIMKPSDPGKDLGQLADNHKKAEESFAAATASGDERAIARAKSLLELQEEQLNAATGGKFRRDTHAGIQQNFATAMPHLNNPKVNYKGVAYDQVDKSKPQDNLSSNDFFVQAITEGRMPTFTVGSDGRPNLDAADNFLKYYGVENTTVASYKKDGSLGLFNYNPTGEKKLTAIQTKAPKPTGGEKPAPAEDNPFRAKAEESQIAQGTQDMDDEIYKIQVEMTSLAKQRESLSTPVKEPFLGREFRSAREEVPFGEFFNYKRETMPERDPEWSANQYDEITAKMRELAKEKSELLEKRRAIKNKK
jgi:hypothetical protein